MAAYFTLKLDTTAPAGVSLTINGGVSVTNDPAVTLAIGATDSDKTGYTMKLWGDIGAGVTEAAASWETFAASRAVTLKAGDGAKTVCVKVRDTVGNVSAQASASVTLDTSAPGVNVSYGPDYATISAQAGYNLCTFKFNADAAFTEYKVKLVPNAGAAHSAGTQIPAAGGSTNMTGAGAFPASTDIACTITGADLSSAASAVDGAYVIKVFTKDAAGNWSV